MLKRSPLHRQDNTSRLSVPVFKPKKCKACKEVFTPTRNIQPRCIDCEHGFVLRHVEKAAKVRAAGERRADKAKRENLKTRGEWLAEAKKEVQKFRRLEELSKGSGCMSCLRPQEEVQATDAWNPGGAWDGGHFISKGARPELALEPLNIWLQCKSCNGGSGKYARKGYTVGQNFETNLRAREGDALVDWLKGPHEPKHYDIEQLKAIKATYRAKTRALNLEK